MEQQAKYEQIEAFLAGNLSGQELIDFEREMREDDDLRTEVELHRQLAAAVGGEQFHEFRAVLKQTDAEWKTQPTAGFGGRVRSLSYWNVSLIAAAIVLLGAMIWLISKPDPKTADMLFAAHFQPYEMVLTQRSTTIDRPVELNAAIAAYAEADYTAAETQFLQLAQAAPEEHLYQLYACVSSLAAGKNEAAIVCFTQLRAIPNLAEQAQWYLGLSYLQKGDNAAAKASLEGIKPGGYQFDAAETILDEL